MALQTSGAISLANIQTESGGANPKSINEYYGVGTVPASGTISLSHFYGQTAQAPAGSQTFTASGTFTVPIGKTSVTVCMCAGGGSGAYATYGSGGGYAGGRINQAVAVTSGQQIAVTVGAGGTYVAPDGLGTTALGHAGSNSSFGGIVAIGGVGGTTTPTNGNKSNPKLYPGLGAGNITTCGGSFHDGTAISYSTGTNTAYQNGGQAGQFGNGGNGAYSVNGGTGGIGAGGGAAGSKYTTNVSYHTGAGGRGQVVVSWS